MNRLLLILLTAIISAGVFPFSPAAAHRPNRADEAGAITIPCLIRRRKA